MFLYENFTYSPVFNYILVYNDMQTWRQWSPGTVYFWTEKTVPNVSRFMYFKSHKYKPSWSFVREKYMYKISVFKSIVGVLTPQDIFKWLCQIYNYNLTQVHRQVTVSVLFYVADCSLHNNLSKLSYYFRTHLQLRLCELWSIYTKKSVLINKFNTFKLNNEYCKIQCKMGY